MLDPNILLLSRTYGVTTYDRKIIADDPDFMHENNLEWVGCPWTEVENVKLWADAVNVSKTK
jgi:hypothetical protein